MKALDLANLFAPMRYPVRLSCGYEILQPIESAYSADTLVRIHDPATDLLVQGALSHSELLGNDPATALNTKIANMLQELDTDTWIARRFRCMSRAWREDLGVLVRS